MKILLQTQTFNPWKELAEYEPVSSDGKTIQARFGATNIFIGTMRDFNEGNDVQTLFLEHYPGMTEKHLEKIALEAMKRWHLDDVFILHRVGEIKPNESIVLIAVWSAHRAEAFDACKYLIDELKHRAPFWKKETNTDGSQRWVEKNT